MKAVTGLLVVLLTFLVGSSSGIKPDNGYCIGNQCFTVFQDPSNYKTAKSQCEALGGHLMTVRSTVSNNILLILLENLTGRFWIGLHRTTGCPDAAAGLKGFQWVTKDNETDFNNWAPTFDNSCSSHRCVSVSKEEHFNWIQEPCDEHAAGFLCEYTFSEPCQILVVGQDESVNYTTPLGFGGEDLLSLPPGSTAIRMPAETNYVCFSEKWHQAPWSCEIHEGGCEYKCAVDPQNVPTCYCPPGTTVSLANKVTCEVDAEDPCLPLRCAHACYKDGDSYTCTCDHGFKLAQDGRSCVDFNDCTDERQCPGENFKCVNTVGGFQCVCEDGYSVEGGLCVDVDECASAPCEQICDNTPGNYSCSCYDGYKEDPKSPNKCKLYCGKAECTPECDPNDQSQCNCPDGYLLDGRENESVCIDIDECYFSYCDHSCNNTLGSYVCSCNPGYTLVEQYKCVKNEGYTEIDGGMEGSGAATIPNIITSSPVPQPDPKPTRQPSGVTVGGLVGIIVCTVFFVVLVVFLAHHILTGRWKMKSAVTLKAAEDEAHGLEVTSDT
ncbi:thrombomodulin-like [Morone saxatilis]|uniref:thrombomodulin-like n=1 Tax=Morone saxatilis TaxID=34816 RepID=UPI0015E1E07F|nr:thrombomodulin-like [Morone saxatilis]